MRAHDHNLSDRDLTAGIARAQAGCDLSSRVWSLALALQLLKLGPTALIAGAVQYASPDGRRVPSICQPRMQARPQSQPLLVQRPRALLRRDEEGVHWLQDSHESHVSM